MALCLSLQTPCAGQHPIFVVVAASLGCTSAPWFNLEASKQAGRLGQSLVWALGDLAVGPQEICSCC